MYLRFSVIAINPSPGNSTVPERKSRLKHLTHAEHRSKGGKVGDWDG